MDVLAAMRTFVAIVDEGSLTAAADALDRSQPAVVRTLAALESHLGARLLRRTTRRQSLTVEGSEYLARCRQILSDVDDAARALSQDDADPQGLVRVTAPVQFGRRHVAPLLTRFLADHRRVGADLLLLDRNVDLIEEGIDLAVRIGPLPDSGLIARAAGSLRRVVCASPALLRERGVPERPEALSGMPCVRLQNVGRAGTWMFDDGGARVAVRVEGPFASNDIGAAIAACIDGVGFGQFLSYQVDDAFRDGRLVRVLAPFDVTDIPVNVVYPGGRLPTARQRLLAEWLQAGLRRRVLRLFGNADADPAPNP